MTVRPLVTTCGQDERNLVLLGQGDAVGVEQLRDAPSHGTERLVIDGAAAMRKKHVFELVKLADVIIVPVLPSAFDQTSTATFLDRLGRAEAVRRNKQAGRHPAQPGPAAHPGGGAPLEVPRPIEHEDLGGLPDRTVYNEVVADGLRSSICRARARRRCARTGAALAYIDEIG